MTVDDNETLMKSINAIGTNAIITDMIIYPSINLALFHAMLSRRMKSRTYVIWYYF